MRIVTWNMDYWKHRTKWDEAWAFLLGEVRPDIALLQEARVPDALAYEVLWTSAVARGTSMRELDWGSAILSRVGTLVTHLVISPEEVAKRGTVQVVSCTIIGVGETTIVNVHSRLGDGAVQKVIPNLRETFEVVLPSLGDRFIVGGDLNTARSLDKAYGPRYGHGDFWRELDAGMLNEALPGDNEERQSYWGTAKGPTAGILQDDHLFFDAETFRLVSESRVWDTPQIRELSDHGPIVVDLDLSAGGRSDT
jgi:endonuclease/exonuclease/phosphatase family metal-dependent hydrolase